jgi:hypothetical protein
MLVEIDTNDKVIKLKSLTTLTELSKFIEEFNLQGWKIQGWWTSEPAQPSWQQYPTYIYNRSSTASPFYPPFTTTCCGETK